MTGCNVNKWLWRDPPPPLFNLVFRPPSRPAPCSNPILAYIQHSASAYSQPHYPMAAKRLGFFVFDFFICVCLLLMPFFVWFGISFSSPSRCCAQVRYVASGFTGRTSRSRRWCWTSPRARAWFGPRRSWTVSYRRSTLSPSRPTTVGRAPMEKTWRSPTSECEAQSIGFQRCRSPL